MFVVGSNDLDVLQNVGVVALGDGGDHLLDVFDVDHVVFDGDALLRDLHRIRRSVLVVGVDGEDVGGCGVLLLAFGQGVIGGDQHVDGFIHRARLADGHAVRIHGQGVDRGVGEGVRGFAHGGSAYDGVQRLIVVAARRLVAQGSNFSPVFKALCVEVLAFVGNLHLLGHAADDGLFVAVSRGKVRAVDHAGMDAVAVIHREVHGKQGAGKGIEGL